MTHPAAAGSTPAAAQPRSARGAVANRLINTLLSVPPIWSIARGRARAMMIRRAERLGIPWTATVTELGAVDWQPLRCIPALRKKSCVFGTRSPSSQIWVLCSPHQGAGNDDDSSRAVG